MSNAFLHLANHHIRDLELYQPGKPIEEVQRELNLSHVIKLASNENPLGPSPKAVAAAQNALSDIHRYPDSRAYSLKHKLAQHWNDTSDHITLGNGSDQILEMIIRTFVKASPQSEVICSEYAFANFAITTKTYGAKPVIVPARNWGHDLNAMAQAITENTQAIFIANPNNPTGTCSIAMSAAVAALEDKEHQEKPLESNKKGKVYLQQALEKLGLEFIPSASNF